MTIPFECDFASTATDWIANNAGMVGWIGGVVSASIIPFVSWLLGRKRFRESLQIELEYLCTTACTVSFHLMMRAGTLRRDYLTWVQARAQVCETSEDREILLRSVVRFERFDEDDLKNTAKIHGELHPGTLRAVPRIMAPFLSANLSSISLLKAREQTKVLRCLRSMEIINTKVDEMTHWQRANDVEGPFPGVVKAIRMHDNARAIIIACISLADEIHELKTGHKDFLKVKL